MALSGRRHPARAPPKNYPHKGLNVDSIDSPLAPGLNGGHDISSVIVPLLKGVLYQADKPDLWNSLLNLQSRVRDYVQIMGLELMLDESEGYAFLRTRPSEEDEDSTKRP